MKREKAEGVLEMSSERALITCAQNYLMSQGQIFLVDFVEGMETKGTAAAMC